MNENAGQPVTAIVVTYKTGKILSDCLEALAAEPLIARIILVDNGNDPQVRAWLDEWARHDQTFVLLRPGQNIGFSAGCNFGARRAETPYLAFVNPDLIVLPGTFASILEQFRKDAKTWVCGGRLLNADGTEQRGGRRDVLTPWRACVELFRLDRMMPNHPHFRRLHQCDAAAALRPVSVPTVSGAFMVVPAHLFRRLGGFDDHMFMHFEDGDFCIRVMNEGGRVVYCGNAPVVHHLSTSDVSRIFLEWQKARSASYYFHKHFHDTYPRWMLTFLSVLLWLRFCFCAALSLPRELPGIRRRRRSGA